MLKSRRGAMFAATAARLASKVYHPHCPPDQAVALATILTRILDEYKALTAEELWEHASMQGVRSKSHMKQLLKWMKQEEMVRTELPSLVTSSRVYKLAGEPSVVLGHLPLKAQAFVQDTGLTREQQLLKELKETPRPPRPLTLWDF